MNQNPKHRLNLVERACTDLAHGDRPVTFTAVASATGLARSTLYRNAALRSIITHHQKTPDGPITALTEEIATLRAAVSTLGERVRNHEEQLRRLRS